MKFTILGASGFIGSHLQAYLQSIGYDVFGPDRGSTEVFNRSLGHVVYAIGLTGDFRLRPFDTVDANILNLIKVLRDAQFDSFLYLSSTRVYSGLASEQLAQEETYLSIRPSADALYDLSKLLGEALCLTHPNERVRVVRLSNVFGVGQSRHTFLAQLLDQLAIEDTLIIGEAFQSGKDYISIVDVVRCLTDIALSGRYRLYNVASGRIVTHETLAEQLRQISGRKVIFRSDAPCRRFPPIDASRLQDEFPFTPICLEDELPRLMAAAHVDIGRNFDAQ